MIICGAPMPAPTYGVSVPERVPERGRRPRRPARPRRARPAARRRAPRRASGTPKIARDLADLVEHLVERQRVGLVAVAPCTPTGDTYVAMPSAASASRGRRRRRPRSSTPSRRRRGPARASSSASWPGTLSESTGIAGDASAYSSGTGPSANAVPTMRSLQRRARGASRSAVDLMVTTRSRRRVDRDLGAAVVDVTGERGCGVADVVGGADSDGVGAAAAQHGEQRQRAVGGEGDDEHGCFGHGVRAPGDRSGRSRPLPARRASGGGVHVAPPEGRPQPGGATRPDPVGFRAPESTAGAASPHVGGKRRLTPVQAAAAAGRSARAAPRRRRPSARRARPTGDAARDRRRRRRYPRARSRRRRTGRRARRGCRRPRAGPARCARRAPGATG